MRTSFHHQPEAQHPKFFSYQQAAGRLPHLRPVRPEGANHQWRKIPPRELSIDLVADERFGRVTGRAGAS